jgi:hypothetical protein
MNEHVRLGFNYFLFGKTQPPVFACELDFSAGTISLTGSSSNQIRSNLIVVTGWKTGRYDSSMITRTMGEP